MIYLTLLGPSQKEVDENLKIWKIVFDLVYNAAKSENKLKLCMQLEKVCQCKPFLFFLLS